MKKMTYRLMMALICVYFSVQTVCAAQLVIPGGQVIGLELQDDTVTVAAFDEELGNAAREGGLKVGDRITHINGKTVSSVQQIRSALSRTDGEAEIMVARDGQKIKLCLKPLITDQGPRLGVFLKQGITGVGTVTWYDPNTESFGALGHGVNNTEGKLVAMEEGKVYNATVLTVKTGKIGAPGQLMSAVTGSGVIGQLTKNTAQGVFGKAKFNTNEQMLPIGQKEQVHTGAATIRSTVKDGKIREYLVDIVKVYPNSGPSGRNMLIKVTDPALLTATGGIVQGMGVSYNKDNQ